MDLTSVINLEIDAKMLCLPRFLKMNDFIQIKRGGTDNPLLLWKSFCLTF